MTTKTVLRTLSFSIGLMAVSSTAALALCGDVTGDGKRQTNDALLVLRSAVGQPVNLKCTDSGPSRLRYYNDFTCDQPTSQATFNDLTFVASSASYSPYQTVSLTDITDVEIKLCGSTYTFGGPIHLPPNRSLSFLMLLLDPDVYGTANGDPAYFVVVDDGASASLLAETPESSSSNVVGMYRGQKVDASR